jgi:hypothetical protein
VYNQRDAVVLYSRDYELVRHARETETCGYAL